MRRYESEGDTNWVEDAAIRNIEKIESIRKRVEDASNREDGISTTKPLYAARIIVSIFEIASVSPIVSIAASSRAKRSIAD